jgi:hypothetical protein
VKTSSSSSGCYTSGDPEEPPGNISTPNRSGLLRQNEKDCLKGIFGKMLISDHALTQAKDHHSMTPDEKFKRFLVPNHSETPEQFGVGRALGSDFVSSRAE